MKQREYTMRYGDRIYARLCLKGKNVLEFVIEKVGSMTELLGELRTHTRELRGLCKLYVRNMSRGWSMERPLMLYPEVYPTANGWKERDFTTMRKVSRPRQPQYPDSH